MQQPPERGPVGLARLTLSFPDGRRTDCSALETQTLMQHCATLAEMMQCCDFGEHTELPLPETAPITKESLDDLLAACDATRGHLMRLLQERPGDFGMLLETADWMQAKSVLSAARREFGRYAVGKSPAALRGAFFAKFANLPSVEAHLLKPNANLSFLNSIHA